MKKIALTLLLSVAGALSVTTATGAEKLSRVTGSGDLILKGNCTASMSLVDPVAVIDQKSVGHNATFTTARLSNSCSGRMWIGAAEMDNQGYGIMTAAGGQQAGWTLRQPTGWAWRDKADNYALVSATEIEKGTTQAVELILTTKGAHGLPTPGVKYTYRVQGGLWVE